MGHRQADRRSSYTGRHRGRLSSFIYFIRSILAPHSTSDPSLPRPCILCQGPQLEERRTTSATHAIIPTQLGAIIPCAHSSNLGVDWLVTSHCP